MNAIEKCIYCGKPFDPNKGQGDHILPVQLGEFRNDVRFRRICPSCNNKIGRSEQQFLRCGTESFFRDLVNPKVPSKRKRGRSQTKAAMGAPGPESTIDHGDHRELVKRSKNNPRDVLPVDQIVIHDEQGQEYFIRLFPGMRPEQLRVQAKKQVAGKIDKSWHHYDEDRKSEYERLIKEAWPKVVIQDLPVTPAGVKQISGRITFKVTDHYFRSLAKIGFHYYLVHTQRGLRGDEECFAPIREFIMNGGDYESFFRSSSPKFIMPYGKLPSGGVKTPKQWCHVMAADESEKDAVVYVQLFVGRGCVPQPNYITLADIKSLILVPRSTWGHVYIYDEAPGTDHYAGSVEIADITRIR